VKAYAGANSSLDEFGFQFADQLQDFGWVKEGQGKLFMHVQQICF
jgi:hypothetical protein